MSTSEYNVYCSHCGSVFSPLVKSPLWWKAKKRAYKGFLDAHWCKPSECGCIEERPISNPDAPYRVLGYDMMCSNYNVPFTNFIEAVKFFRERVSFGDVVFPQGLSDKVVRKIEYPNW